MTAKINTTGKKLPRITVTSPRLPRMEPTAVAKALGAEPAADRAEGHPAALTLYALRAEIMRRLVSQGGRPRIEGTNQRVKIPVKDQDWHALESLASSLASKGFTPSPGQVASVLLNMAIQAVNTSAENPALISQIAEQLGQPVSAHH
jgi:hypothetical protein